MSPRPSDRVRVGLLGCAVACGALFISPVRAAGPQNPARSTTPFATDGARVDTRHLSLATSASAATVAPRGRVTLFIDVTPKPKMHVYSPEQQDVIPVGITLAADEVVRPGAIKFPTPEKYFFAPLKETQLVYSKPFRLAQEVRLSGTPGASLIIKGTLRYQACDEAICYLPQNVPVSWTVALKR